MGIVNQFNKFTNHLASKSKLLRDLLCKDSVWYWGDKQNESFNDLKKCLISVSMLALYAPNKETKINADASSYGIGGVVIQKQENTYHVHLQIQIQNLDIVKFKKNAWHSRGRVRDRVIIF
jgi:hypothetical protein